MNGPKGTNTRLAHIGNRPEDYFGFVNPPIVRASTVLYPNAEALSSREQKYTYGTHGTPTTDALAAAVNDLEGSAGTVFQPSGLAAVTTPLLAFLAAGDHALIVDSVYGPTRRFANKMLSRFGVAVDYFAPETGADIAEAIRPNTKVVFLESPGSNTYELQDVGAIAEVAHRAGAVVMMDNTWATPLYFRPLDHGVDISINAATKYPAGHSDILFGWVSANAACWSRLHETQTNLGLCVSSDEAYQVLRGLRTMGVRLDRHRDSALEIAAWLEGQPKIARVLHPGLTSHPQHALFRRDFKGSSGVFSIVLDGGGLAEARAFLNALEIFGLGYSWGGFESLAVLVNLEDRTIAQRRAGPVIRLQIGLEDPADIKADLEAGLRAIGA